MRMIHRVFIATTVAFLSSAGFAVPPAELPIGVVSRDQVEALVANWGVDVNVDDQWTQRVEDIRRVRNGATVKVFMGAWCEDSRHEIPQFLKILDVLNGDAPFTVEFFTVDQRKEQPLREIEANAIWFVPTFIVLRNGHEVGRIVEQPARTLEKDLLRLLNGTAHGLLSSSENAIVRYLAGEPPVPPSP